MDQLPRQLSRTEIYHSPWVNLFVDRVAFPDGRVVERHHVLDFPSPGAMALVVRCRAGGDTGVFDRNEVRSVRWFTRPEIAAMVRDGAIRDGFSLTALLLYLLEPGVS